MSRLGVAKYVEVKHMVEWDLDWEVGLHYRKLGSFFGLWARSDVYMYLTVLKYK